MEAKVLATLNIGRNKKIKEDSEEESRIYKEILEETDEEILRKIKEKLDKIPID